MLVSAESAARNNAELCHAVFAAHGQTGTFGSHSWPCRGQAPLFYPNLVTLTQDFSTDAPSEALLKHLDRDLPDGWAIKDSFDCLDLSSSGFESLFSATWLCHPPLQLRDNNAASDLHWHRIQSSSDLQSWRSAWHAGAQDDENSPIVLALLARRDIDILAGSGDGKIQAGCILNRSTNVVGLSNIFRSEAAPDDWLASCKSTISRLHPDPPIVGYDSGEMLQTMRDDGFQEIGPLRVWLRRERS